MRIFIEKKNDSFVNLLYSRNGIVNEIKVDVIDKKIGVRGTIENKKLNLPDSIVESFNQIVYFTQATLVGVMRFLQVQEGQMNLEVQ